MTNEEFANLNVGDIIRSQSIGMRLIPMCEVCGKESEAGVCDSIEGESVDGWKTFNPVEMHFFCQKHARGPITYASVADLKRFGAP